MGDKCETCGSIRPEIPRMVQYGALFSKTPCQDRFHHDTQTTLPKCPTVADIIGVWLRSNGYDGLAGDECGCAVGDINCDLCSDCQPAYHVSCENCYRIQNRDEYGCLYGGPNDFGCYFTSKNGE